MSVEAYKFGADVVLVTHAAYVAFVVGGQVLIMAGWIRAWGWTRNPWFRWIHLGAIGLVILESWFGIVCPLTAIESALRAGAGQAHHELGFIAYWVQRLLFYSAPAWVFAVLYSMFGLVVLASLILYPPTRNIGCKQRSKNAE